MLLTGACSNGEPEATLAELVELRLMLAVILSSAPPPVKKVLNAVYPLLVNAKVYLPALMPYVSLPLASVVTVAVVPSGLVTLTDVLATAKPLLWSFTANVMVVTNAGGLMRS